MFTPDELDQARATPVLEIAERHGARLKRSGKQHEGPCPVCRCGDDRFWVVPSLNVGGCRRCGFRGDAIALEMHLSGSSFVDAVKSLIGRDAGTPARRRPTPEEIAARLAAQETQRQEAAAEAAKNDRRAAEIVVKIRPVAGTPGEAYLRGVRHIDVCHWAIRRALQSGDAIIWSERTFFNQPDPEKPLHEFHGQYFGAIIGILTDPITGERTGGITRTYLHEGRKICRAMSLGGAGRLGIIRLSPDDAVLMGLHLCEGIESALSAMMMGFLPMWATGSTSQMAAFPVLDGIECLTVIADNDDAGLKAAREACQRWADAGRDARVQTLIEPGDINDAVRRIS